MHFIFAPGYKECFFRPMKQILFGITAMILQCTYAQNRDINILEKDRLIRRVMSSEPDSARILIQEILNYKGKLSDTVYANAYLAYAYYHHLKNNTDSSLYYYERALPYSNKQKYPKIYARLLRNKAGTYKKRGEIEESLKILSEVENIYSQTNDEIGLAITYGEIASNYNLMLRSDEGINYLLKALSIFEKKNDYLHSLSVKHSLANTYLNAGNFEFAADLYKEVLIGFKEQNAVKNYCIALLNYGDCLTHLKKYNEAQKALNDALPGLKRFDDQEIIGLVYYKMGIIQARLNHLSAAESYYKIALKKALPTLSLKTIPIGTDYIDVLIRQKKYKEALEIISLIEKPELLQKANVYDLMLFETQKAKVYEKTDSDEKALLSIQNSLKLQDTLKKTANELTTLRLQQEFQNKYQSKKSKTLENANLNLKNKLNRNRKNILLPVICLLIILAIIALAFVFKTRKRLNRLKLAQKRKEKLLREYEETKNLNEMNKQDLQDKTQELTSGIVSLTTLEGSINRLIILCKEKPEDLCIDVIKEELQSLTSEKNYWSLFKKRFSETYAGFQENLQAQFPALTKNDLFFCALLKLNLPYKDMAALMQVAPETIVKKKYRVKKKMKIETEAELESILLNTSL
ncbi:MAG: hypothetical protein DI539_15330 [Flavobacterium psychrophilum]|nr:MAG: hypothetical protein DI539_15330 [Flavobacterium psychrophilum]